MGIFISYSSSYVDETEELLRALQRSFGDVDWIDHDGAPEPHPAPSHQTCHMGHVTASRNGNILLVLLSSTLKADELRPDSVRRLIGENANVALSPTFSRVFGSDNECLVQERVYSFGGPKPFGQSGEDFAQLQLSRLRESAFPATAAVVIGRNNARRIGPRDNPRADKSGFRAIMNIARSIRPFDALALRRMKARAMLQLLSSQIMSKSNNVYLDWRRSDPLVLLIKPNLVIDRVEGCEQQGRGVDSIGVLRATSNELGSFLSTIIEELGVIRRKYQPEQKPWVMSVVEAASQVLKGSAKVKTYSIAKITEMRKHTVRFGRRSRFVDVGSLASLMPSGTLSQLIRGTEGPLSAGLELRLRTEKLVRGRSLFAAAAIAKRVSEDDTVFSLYRGFELPDL